MNDVAPERSAIMRAIKGWDTQPELAVRRMVYGMGYRYRLHRKDLPGKPDLALSLLRKAIFVHGCFWHGHCCRRGARVPKSNQNYWISKVERNRSRDAKNIEALTLKGWKVLVIWECETRDENKMKMRVNKFLAGRSND